MSEADTGTLVARPRGSQFRAIAISIAVLALVLGALFAWRVLRSGQPQAWPQQTMPVAATRVMQREVPASLEAVGTLTAVREVVLSSQVAGRVSNLFFDSGRSVSTGTLLVQLDDGPERADRRAAQARNAFASAQLGRTEQLVPAGAESRDLLQQRRAERDQASAAVSQIDARLRQMQIRAPFPGEVGLRRVNPGQYLNPGDPIATLTALDRLYVEFSVPQQELARLKAGSTVRVRSDAFPGREFAARVNAVEPKIDPETRNVTVQALLPNPGRNLRPGMYVTASFTLPPEAGALVVPATAIQTSAQGESLIVIRGPNAAKDGKAEIVPILTGRRFGSEVIVTKGLKPGDVVVTEGQLRVQSGAPVKVSRLVPAGGR